MNDQLLSQYIGKRTSAFACLFVTAGVGFAVGALAVYVGLQHNSQQEFNLPNGSLDWSYAGILFAAWFAVGCVGAVVLCGAVSLIAFIVHSLNSRRE